MSGKPAARQGDMTQYGGPIVRGSAGVRIGAPTGVACSVCPGRMTSGNPVNPLLGRRCCPARRTLRCPARCRSFSPAPTAATGRRRLRRWEFWPRLKAPSDIRLQIRDDGLILNDNGGRSIHFEPLLGRRCTAAASQCGWFAVVRQRSRTATRWHGCGRRCRRISG